MSHWRISAFVLGMAVFAAPTGSPQAQAQTNTLISVGRETFLADALRRAGAESVVHTAQDWPRLNLEEVVRLQPDYLVFANSHSEAVERNLQELRQRPGWRNLEAIRRRRIAIVSDAVNRPSPRLVDAIEQLARQLHPEAFASNPEMRNSRMGIRPPGQVESPHGREARACAR